MRLTIKAILCFSLALDLAAAKAHAQSHSTTRGDFASAARGEDRAEQLRLARQKIKHVIIIMQENRSFDEYFGTYPRANGIPKGVCMPLVAGKTGCVAPYHNPLDITAGGPHTNVSAYADIDDGITTAKLDGFVAQQTIAHVASCHPDTAPNCVASYQAISRHDVMGYKNGSDIPNYWELAGKFVLQDQLFESVRSWSFPAHLYLTSEWAAICTNEADASTCVTSPEPTWPANHEVNVPWVSLFQLLDVAGVSWKYYLGDGVEPDCDDDEMSCDAKPQAHGTGSIWNPAPLYTYVQAQGTDYMDLHNPPYTQFFTDLSKGTLPQVSWIIPSIEVSEHPPSSVTRGMEYVTGLVDAVMRSPYWANTAIFIAWDDWGGFYDHVVPPIVDANHSGTPVQGYGLRVPGLLVSAYARSGFIDHSVLSLDSYATFIEDLFANSTRLVPSAFGNPDARPTIRDSLTDARSISGQVVPIGSFVDEFNFTRAPLPPTVLPVNIPVGLSAACGATIKTFLCASAAVTLTWEPIEQAIGTGTPPYTYHILRDGADLPACAGTATSCMDRPGPGPHLYQTYSIDAAGMISMPSGALEADEPPATQAPRPH
jgi:phospholipase C